MSLIFRSTGGETRSLANTEVGALAGSMRGRLVRPDAEDYEEVRRIWNAMIEPSPALIASCRGPADVITAVKFAAKHGIVMSIRGGGHNIAGSALCDAGLVIDLSPMRGVRVDPERGRVWVEGGALLSDVD